MAPTVADAAGLGKVAVFSALGQPLRAEIEVAATREELSGMKAQLASRDAFRQAGIDFASTLQGISFTLDKRPNGQSVIRLTSAAPINDPFVDMLVELNWPTGRLVREYTFLLDPPEIVAKNAPATAPVTRKAQVQEIPAAPPVTPVSTVTPAPTQTAAPVTATSSSAPIPSSIDEETRARARDASQRGELEAAATPTTSAEHGEGREVKKGDTLSKIADAVKPEGVTLEQMLVGLLRANQDAFDGGNMNRLRTGKILTIPDKAALEAVAPAEARKVVMAQASDWNAYRGKLAAIAAKAPATESSASQASAGKITAKVEDKQAPAAAPKDQVKVSKSETGAAKAGVPGKRSDEDAVVKERALKEANERTAALEKNVANLQKLLELKDQNLADLQKQSGAKDDAKKVAEPAAAVKPPAAKAVEAPKPAEAAPAPIPPVVPSAPAVAPAEPAPAAKAEEPGKAKPAVVVPPEPSFVDVLLEDPLLPAAGGAGILALLAGLFLVRRRRAAKEEVAAAVSTPVAPMPEADVAATVAVASATEVGAEPVSASALTEMAPQDSGSEETNEVDPVAEAEVYMAYGRDTQAEEILLEAKKNDPTRYAIHLKLLEIYANRKDLAQFELQATELHGATGGLGADWEKAAALGLKLDPTNPLYGGEAGEQALGADATVIVEASESLSPDTVEVVDLAPAPEEESPTSLSVETLDFDLGPEVSPATESTAAAELPSEETSAAAELDVLDFDLGSPAPKAVSEAVAEAVSETEIQAVIEASPSDTGITTLDFDLPDLNLGGASEAQAPQAEPLDVTSLDFDLDFASESPAADTTERVEAPVELPALDKDLSFDLDDLPAAPAVVDEELPIEAAPVAADLHLIVEDEPEPDSSLSLETGDEASLPRASFDMKSITLDLEAAVAAGDVLTDEGKVEVAEASAPKAAPALDVDPLEFEPSSEAVSDPESVASPASALPEELSDFDLSLNEEAATKLDLAKAYEEMGDLEGARELLNEVLKEGDANQRQKATAILNKIGA